MGMGVGDIGEGFIGRILGLRAATAATGAGDGQAGALRRPVLPPAPAKATVAPALATDPTASILARLSGGMTGIAGTLDQNPTRSCLDARAAPLVPEVPHA